MTRLPASAVGLLIAEAWLREPLTADVVARSVLILGAVVTVPGRRTP